MCYRTSPENRSVSKVSLSLALYKQNNKTRPALSHLRRTIHPATCLPINFLPLGKRILTKIITMPAIKCHANLTKLLK